MTTKEMTRPVANPLAAIDANAEPYVNAVAERKSMLEKIFAQAMERKSSLELTFTERPVWSRYKQVQPEVEAPGQGREEAVVEGFFGRLKRAIAGILG